MQRIWSDTEIHAHWSLGQEELALVRKYRGINRLRCAALLKYFQIEWRFPRAFSDIPLQGVRWLCRVLDLPSEEATLGYEYLDATSKRQRRDIRKLLGVRPSGKADCELAQRQLTETIICNTNSGISVDELAKAWFRDNRIELPSTGQLERIVVSALASAEDGVFGGIAGLLPDESKQALDRLLVPTIGEETDGTTAPFSLLKADPGKPRLNSVFAELSKLSDIDAVNLPAGLFDSISGKTLHLYRSRAATESVRDMRLHPDNIRHTLAAAFCYERRQEIIDGLIELLIQIVHTIRVRAEKKVIQELVASIREVSGKKTVLLKIAQAAIENPDGTIREVLFPAAREMFRFRMPRLMGLCRNPSGRF